MKKFSTIKESLETSMLDNPDTDILGKDLLDMVKNTTNSDDKDLAISLMRSFINDSSTTIMGLVNDSEVFDLYMTHVADIDSILSDNVEFEKSPNELNMASIYDYLIEMTKVAVTYKFKDILE